MGKINSAAIPTGIPVNANSTAKCSPSPPRSPLQVNHSGAVLIVHPYTQFVNQRLEVKEPKQCINLSYLLCMENSHYFYAKQFPVALPPLNILLIKVGISRGFSLSSPWIPETSSQCLLFHLFFHFILIALYFFPRCHLKPGINMIWGNVFAYFSLTALLKPEN